MSFIHHQRFTHATRYYELRIERDLFGWSVVKCYGRIGTKLGQVRSVAFETHSEAIDFFEAQWARRIKRGYQLE